MSEFEDLSSEEQEYYVLNLPYHLARAGADMTNEFCDMLTDFDFLRYKIEVKNVSILIEDYQHENNNRELKLIQRALEMSANTLDKDKAQLAGQLLGRLLKFMSLPKIEELLNVAKNYQDSSWLRPLTSSLNLPEDSLVYTLNFEHSSAMDRVTGVAVTPDNKFLVSSS